MKSIEQCVQRDGITDPQQAMQAGYDQLLQSVGRDKVRGSSTCLLATLGPVAPASADKKDTAATAAGNSKDTAASSSSFTLRLRTANVGDCALLVLRHDGQRWRRVFETAEGRIGNFPYQLGVHESGSTPAVAVRNEFTVRTGDVIVACTDGVTDNIGVEQAFTTLAPPATGAKPLDIAQGLVRLAVQADRKPDDTTAMVALITGQPPA